MLAVVLQPDACDEDSGYDYDDDTTTITATTITTTTTTATATTGEAPRRSVPKLGRRNRKLSPDGCWNRSHPFDTGYIRRWLACCNGVVTRQRVAARRDAMPAAPLLGPGWAISYSPSPLQPQLQPRVRLVARLALLAAARAEAGEHLFT